MNRNTCHFERVKVSLGSFSPLMSKFIGSSKRAGRPKIAENVDPVCLWRQMDTFELERVKVSLGSFDHSVYFSQNSRIGL